MYSVLVCVLCMVVCGVQVKETSSWKRPWPLSINTRWDVGSAGDVGWKPTWSYRPRATPPSFFSSCERRSSLFSAFRGNNDNNNSTNVMFEISGNTLRARPVEIIVLYGACIVKSRFDVVYSFNRMN